MLIFFYLYTRMVHSVLMYSFLFFTPYGAVPRCSSSIFTSVWCTALLVSLLFSVWCIAVFLSFSYSLHMYCMVVVLSILWCVHPTRYTPTGAALLLYSTHVRCISGVIIFLFLCTCGADILLTYSVIVLCSILRHAPRCVNNCLISISKRKHN